MYFSEENITQLMEDYSKVEQSYESVLVAYGMHRFSNPLAAEFAMHGFVRRVKTLKRCIENIYVICPPARSSKLASQELSDLTINLQGFVFNVFGCLDNLAWVWVKEKNVTNTKGQELKSSQIGLGENEKYEYVLKSLPDDLRNYLETERHKKWHKHLEDFRHALAHRIPLYVPPYVVNDEEAAKERELEGLRTTALKAHRFDEYERLSEEIEKIGKFVPWMTHSFSEESKHVVFHAQILADWNTVIEVAQKFLSEL